MAKRTIFCPHCGKEFTPPPKARKQVAEKDPVFIDSLAYWLDILHPGWSFSGAQGKSLKSLLLKLKNAILKAGKVEYTEKLHFEYFKLFCQNLPEWFKDKDLQVLNSKFNEIIEQMKKGKTQNNGNWHTKNSAQRYATSKFRE